MSKKESKVSQVDHAYTVLRERVAQMSVGVPLPSVAALMGELSVSQATISGAYARLQRDGFITRCPGKGVFVADPRTSGEIAVVIQSERLSEESSPHYRNVMAGLNRALGALDADWQLKVHVGRLVQELEDFPDTLDLSAPDLRGVFTFEPLFDVESALAERGVPIVGLLPRPERCWVGYDRDDFIVSSMAHFRTVGCRSIAAISARSLKRSRLLGVTSDVGEKITQAADDCAIEWRPEWMLVDEGVPTEAFGYDMFSTLWNMGERPDALLVTDDVVCGGVLRAMLQLGVEMPRDIRLISFANKHAPLPYHEPVTRFELDPDAVADVAVTMMNDLIYGRPVGQSAHLVKGEFIKGSTT